MPDQNRTYDAIIVGGGHNGLIAACYLAKAGKSVLLLESNGELGGATTSIKLFPEYEAYLSRYSYLVSLLPDQIVHDLGIQFTTLPRRVSSFTPYQSGDRNDGLMVSNHWDKETDNSFYRLTGSHSEGKAWRKFYGELEELAARLAPFFLQPLLEASELKSAVGLTEIWNQVIETPIDQVICDRFKNDIVRGVAFTDAVIGTFAPVDDMRANACFLYHIVGNGTGQWRVPKGGMGTLIKELKRVATSHGVRFELNSKVTELESGDNGIAVTTQSGARHTGRDLLFAAAPQQLAQLMGRTPQSTLEGSQLKMNMLVERLPELKSGADTQRAFSGTFHVNESFNQIQQAYQTATANQLPKPLPLEMYCHTLADKTILSDELATKGYHTLTLFGLHTPCSLFESDPEGAREVAKQHAIDSLNEYLIDPIESVLATIDGSSKAIEVVSPLDLEQELSLPKGNIFHRELTLPFLTEQEDPNGTIRWGGETDDPHILLAGAGARRGGGVSGIAGHNAAMAILQPN